MSGPSGHLAGRSSIHAGVAFLAMGGWAAFANRHHAMPTPLTAMAIQGTISALITLVLKRVIEALAGRFAGLAALIAPPAIACVLSSVVLVAMHSLGSTPEIGWTIAVPLTVSTSYATLYSLVLWRARRDEEGGRGR